MEATPIYVDYRGEQDTVSRLMFLIDPDLVVPNQQLAHGDLHWATDEASYGVELKSSSDFLHSLWSKEDGQRLEWQLEGLRKSVDVPILGRHGLLTGSNETITLYKNPVLSKGGGYQAKMITETKYYKSSVDGFLWSIQNPDDGKGVYVIERDSKEDLLRAIVSIYDWSQRAEHKTFRRSILRRTDVGRGEEGGSNYGLQILAGFPGVGERRARELIGYFKTLGAVMAATEEELRKVHGVGPGLARSMRRVIDG